ncbi:MAG: HAMP domain-containing histidine kinase [Acidobacteria bacterium]|nr:HAMP domain-containing histidine kinase [Acidobacteriota bacterium]
MVSVSGRRRSVIFFATLGIVMVALAVMLNVGWIVNWRTGVMYVLGLLAFLALIAGLALNTIFLIREIRRNEQHNAFIDAMTHELKTPVASIRLYLETLQKRELPPEKRQQFYQIMLEDSDRLLRTIDQVLRAGSVSRLSRAARLRSPVDLTELVVECADLARTRNHLPAESIVVAPMPDAAVVLGDPEELKGVIMNLLDNAVKYSGKRVNIQVTLSLAPSRKFANLDIQDDGIGIPENELKRIFKRFYRVPGSVTGRIKGSGLGLFIVRSVIEKHGGKVTAESRGAGKGSTFRLQLPLATVNS